MPLRSGVRSRSSTTTARGEDRSGGVDGAGRETGSYAVVLVTQPRADVTIAVAVPEEASLRAEPSWLTFTSRNWSTPRR